AAFDAAVQAAANADKAAGRRVFVVTGDDNMKFGLTRLEVSPGETFVVILKNIGRQPKEAMGHNWVLLKKGVDGRAYCQAAVKAKDTEYLPPELGSQVLAATKMLGPGEFDRVEITAPAELGSYPYVCSFPAHYELGMKGVLAVTP
ncbi:plastocyanin/azurin family copper-binding protein, partial [Geminisphaera colitermitum]|uniref:plastocyanin/azurin family copper-binding protein n=1 Tax=Geminisphaera colitermitum TaxID=1148786 RepID=UPI0005BDDCD4